MNLEKLKSRVDKQVPQLKLKDLDAFSLWSPMFRATMLKSPKKLLADFGIEPPGGAVFLGEPGNGRHTAAEALAGSKCNPEAKEYHHYLRITGWDFDCETAEESCRIAEYAVQTAKEYEYFCLFIDSPEESKFGKQFQYRLAEKLREAGTTVFVILLTKDSDCLCRELTGSFKICRCVPPTKAQREEWIKKNMENPFIAAENMTHMELAEKTEGFSWKQLNDMLESMKQLLVWKYFKLFREHNGNLKLLGEAVGTGKEVLTNGEAEQIIKSMVSQKPVSVIAGIAGQVQTAKDETEKEKTGGSENQESVQAQIIKEAEFHKHPEEMTPDQLFEI